MQRAVQRRGEVQCCLLAAVAFLVGGSSLTAFVSAVGESSESVAGLRVNPSETESIAIASHLDVPPPLLLIRTIPWQLHNNATEQLLRSAYARSFGESVEHPAYYVETNNAECSEPRFPRKVTSTVYLKVSETQSNLMIVKALEDRKIQEATARRVLTPAGEIDVLTLLVRHPETVRDDAEQLWREAQAEINADHVAFAKSRGYERALVSFRNTNVMIDPSDVGGGFQNARTMATELGIRTEGQHVVMLVDLNPRRPSGGRANRRFNTVYVGYYVSRPSPLRREHWRDVAKVAYHHEVAHLWGWDHDWAATCATSSFKPFVTPTTLFGWEDTDGDGVPEIRDDTPYGRSRGR